MPETQAKPELTSVPSTAPDCSQPVDGLAVKKTFRHECLHYLDREASFMAAMSQHRSEILPVLERGPNYFIAPFVDGPALRSTLLGRPMPKLMTLGQTRKLADLMRFLFANGFDPVDFAPYNLLIAKSGELKAIDFEFVHRNDGPISPERSACLRGIKADFDGEWTPAALWDRKRYHHHPYNELWFAHTGLPLRSFLLDPPWLQRIKRAGYYPAFIARRAGRRGSQAFRNLVKQAIRQRMPVLTRAAVHAFRSSAG